MSDYLFEAKTYNQKISLSALPPEAWTYVNGDGAGGDLWRKVPFMRRAVDVVAWGITQVPFYFTRKGKVVTDASSYIDPTKGLLPNPRRNFSQEATALLLYGKAYRHIEKDALTERYPLALKWLTPGSVKPVITQAGLQGFVRTVEGAPLPFSVDEVLHFWLTDPEVEIGPPLSSAADAALRAAGAANSVDEFVEMFFKRGAIKATVFTASNVMPSDQEKLKTWAERMFDGIRSAFRPKVFNAEKITPVVIGEGLENLENQSLSGRLREDIATALGIPQSILFSNAANYAVSSQDYKNLFTLTIAPLADAIAEAYNTQLLDKYGLMLEFDPESMDIFQEDESQRAGALAQLVTAVTGAPPKVVTTLMQMVGMELPGEMTYQEFEQILSDAQPTPAPEPAPVPVSVQLPDPTPNPSPDEPPSMMSADLRKWERKAAKALKDGNRGRMVEFESEYIPPTVRQVVTNGLQNASTADEVKAVFEQVLTPSASDLSGVLAQFKQLMESVTDANA